MKTYTIPELDKIFDEGVYRYISLYNNKDEVLISYNPPSMSYKEGWKRVKKRLQAKGLSDGFYVVKGKMIHDKKMIPDEFGVKIGKFEEKDLPAPPLSEAPPKVDQVLTYGAAIKSNKEISDLTAEVSRLELEIKQKDECIADLEADLEESETEMGQLADRQNVGNGQQYLQDLMAAAIPIADEYFKVRNREIALKERQMNGDKVGGAPPSSPAYQSPEVQQERQQQPYPTNEDSKKFLAEMGELLKTDPQEYQRIMEQAQLDNE